MAEPNPLRNRNDEADHGIRRPNFLDRANLDLCDNILDLSQDDQPDIAEIASLAGKSPALSGLVIERVNSARNGLLHPISSVRQAVAMLGARGVGDAVRRLVESGSARVGSRSVRIDQTH